MMPLRLLRVPRLIRVVLWAMGTHQVCPASPACAACHLDIYEAQLASRHAQTLRPFEGSRLSLYLAAAPVAEKGGYQFAYRRGSVSATRGPDQAAASLEWAFGAGSLGFTALGRFGGRYFEHRVSYFTVAGQPGITPGQPPGPPRSAVAALGIFKPPRDAYDCFNCHSTGLERDADGGPTLAEMSPGVQCERCHGPGPRHMEAAHSNRSPAEIRQAVFNAGRMPANASVQVCGGCHRTPPPGAASPHPEIDNPVTVRFQPIGLMASECFRKSGRLSCLTCHDPHRDAIRNNDGFYSGKCLACHATPAAKASACKRGQGQNCLPCHMRRASLAPYLVFTDHRIRVY
jgi:Cytochrome c554 and c-prime